MGVCRWLKGKLDVAYKAAMLVLAISASILAGIGVDFVIRTYWRPQLELIAVGVAPNETVSGTAAIRVSTTGRSFTDIRMIVESEAGECLSTSGVDASVPQLLDTTTLADGPYILAIEVSRGETLLKRTLIPFLVDNTGPVLEVMGLSAGEIVGGVVSLEASVSPPDESAVPQLLLDEGTVISSGELDTRWLSDGYHSIRAVAVDRFGNRSDVVVPFVSDNTTPAGLILGIGPNGEVGMAQEISVAVDEPSPVEVLWFTGSVSEEPLAIGPTLQSDVLPEGGSTLFARITDSAGNETVLDEAIWKDGSLPEVADALGPGNLILHPHSFLYTGFSANELVTQTIRIQSQSEEGSWIRLSRFSPQDEVDVEVAYTNTCGNQVAHHFSVSLDRSLAGTLGFADHVGNALLVRTSKSIPKAFGNLVKLWSEIGLGSTGWRALPPWESEEGKSGFLRFTNGIEVYASLPKQLCGARVPILGLARSGEERSVMDAYLLLDIGGYQRVVSSESVETGRIDGDPWVYDETVESAAWMKLSPTIDLAGFLSDRMVRDFVGVEISIGAGIAMHTTTNRLAHTSRWTDDEGKTHTRTAYEPLTTDRAAGLFPVFQLAISVKPLPTGWRDALLESLPEYAR